jgi:hypothetical protein
MLQMRPFFSDETPDTFWRYLVSACFLPPFNGHGVSSAGIHLQPASIHFNGHAWRNFLVSHLHGCMCYNVVFSMSIISYLT